jgi:hypothetical protein
MRSSESKTARGNLVLNFNFKPASEFHLNHATTGTGRVYYYNVLVAIGGEDVSDALVLILIGAVRLHAQGVEGQRREVNGLQHQQLTALHVQRKEVDVVNAQRQEHRRERHARNLPVQ